MVFTFCYIPVGTDPLSLGVWVVIITVCIKINSSKSE